MTDLAFRTATELLDLLARREVGARELLEHHLSRIERLNPGLNAIVWMNAGQARDEADAIDRRRAEGAPLGPLAGLPITVKESFDLAGAPTTWGDPAFRDNIALTDAAVVARYRAAGAVVIGKTNVPLMLADWQSFNAIYGTTNNPWNPALSPGGSSGGSAAALAAGLSALEAGSDIGASIRNPAHYCGVFGHKPTFGLLPRRGQALPGNLAATDIAVVGPMARSAADLELAMKVLAVADGPDARGLRVDLAPPRRSALAGLRVSLVLDDAEAEVDRPVRDALATLGRWLAAEGAEVSADARPAIDSAEAMEVYVRLLRAATSKRLSAADADAARAELAAGTAAPGSYRHRMLEAQLMPHRDWLNRDERRHAMMAAWEAFFERFDVMLCPAAASTAVPHDQAGQRHERVIEVNGHAVPVTDQLFWAGYTGVAYLPATVAPCAITPAGLPVGVQIVGRRFDDRTCLAVARMIEEGYARFVPPPEC